MSAIIRAVDSVEGGQAQLARELGVSIQFVNQWVRGVRPVPARHVRKIEAITGISCHELRPDVFGPPPSEGQHEDVKHAA